MEQPQMWAIIFEDGLRVWKPRYEWYDAVVIAGRKGIVPELYPLRDYVRLVWGNKEDKLVLGYRPPEREIAQWDQVEAFIQRTPEEMIEEWVRSKTPLKEEI